MEKSEIRNSMISIRQCFHNPFTISKIPFFRKNFPATQTVEKLRKFREKVS
jgi:hypothetical protein